MLFISNIIRTMRKDREKGFTLIELMIVVAILGILAAIAIPNFMRFQAKSKQSEAKTNLGAVGTTAEAWRTERDTYVATVAELGWAPQGNTRYGYSYNALLLAANITAGNCATSGALNAAAVATAATFIAVANGDVDADATCDVWQYNELRALTNPTNDVSS